MRLRCAAVLCVLLAAAACGQKGPLFLPGDPNQGRIVLPEELGGEEQGERVEEPGEAPADADDADQAPGADEPAQAPEANEPEQGPPDAREPGQAPNAEAPADAPDAVGPAQHDALSPRAEDPGEGNDDRNDEQ